MLTTTLVWAWAALRALGCARRMRRSVATQTVPGAVDGLPAWAEAGWPADFVPDGRDLSRHYECMSCFRVADPPWRRPDDHLTVWCGPCYAVMLRMQGALRSDPSLSQRSLPSTIFVPRLPADPPARTEVGPGRPPLIDFSDDAEAQKHSVAL